LENQLSKGKGRHSTWERKPKQGGGGPAKKLAVTARGKKGKKGLNKMQGKKNLKHNQQTRQRERKFLKKQRKAVGIR